MLDDPTTKLTGCTEFAISQTVATADSSAQTECSGEENQRRSRHGFGTGSALDGRAVRQSVRGRFQHWNRPFLFELRFCAVSVKGSFF